MSNIYTFPPQQKLYIYTLYFSVSRTYIDFFY